MAGLCGWALSSSCPPFARAPELCQLCGWAHAPELCQLCGWPLWLGSVSRPCPPLVPPRTLSTVWLGSVAGLGVQALSSSCPPLGRPVKSVAGLCGWARCPGLVLLLSSSWPPLELCQLCGWALCPGLVLLNSVNSVAGLCVQALPSCCPWLGRALELCQLCGWAVWLGSVSRPCPPLGRAGLVLLDSVNSVAGLSTLWLALCPGLVLLNSVNSVAGLCVQALSSSWPRPCQLCGWALCPGLVLLLAAPGSVSRPCRPLVLLLAAPLNSVNSVAGFCGWALCPGLVLLLAAPLNSVNSVAGLCGWSLWHAL